ncbi:hypothetical protein [Cronobacter sakazakii]|uniref:hypothetical protein n=1 Tax=Cronobacter sakazakii TaxID=28141 RepID=UPI0009BB430A|nr:hypothetical protein [Cronobacter sakazakii]EGT4443925.1 hypothetical protein [Cronobacter sakazakii]EGT5709254.1 hypothetical protein [Cronobacter sakazakii]EJG0809405.1 hypothetical protein [Cronobacter sakazakii]EKK4014459.1 hypothetical protein [Cronobacter sakazakii]ELY3384522.1 hypothetical protein [Cronobacter sakazakii]
MGIIAKYIKTFLALITIYIVLMFIAFSLPEGNLQHHVNDAVKVFKREGIYYPPNQDYHEQTKVDNYTDVQVMIARTVVHGSPISHSMEMANYSRYWHGYQVWLRPMMIAMDYRNVRIIYGVAVIIMLCAAFHFISKAASFRIGIAFAATMALSHVEVFGLSMQYSNIFLITFAFLIFISLKRERIKSAPDSVYFYFFIVGSVVSFVDLLTVPIVSLGMPMVLILVILSQRSDLSVKDNCVTVVVSSLVWGIGYATTWITKWIVASAILMKNVPADAIHQMTFRVMGDQRFPTDRLEMLRLNIDTMFMDKNVLLALIITTITMYIVGIKNKFATITPLLLTCFMPYAWYLILANHSQIHYFFTYRSQAVLLFAALAIISVKLKGKEQ